MEPGWCLGQEHPRDGMWVCSLLFRGMEDGVGTSQVGTTCIPSLLPSLCSRIWCQGTDLPTSDGTGAKLLMRLPGLPRAMTATVQTLRFKLLPHDTGQEWVHSCQQEIERRYQVVPSVVCAMCCLFGIIYCFFGYRCFKAVMFLTGLMFGSIIIFMLCYKERVLDTQLSVEASVGIGLGIGVLCGLVTMLVRSVGLFMVGLLLGLLLAVATLVVMEQFYHPPTVWIPIALLLGVGMLFAVLTLQWQRFFTTLSTAVFGSAIMTVTVDYFIELFLLVQYIYERIKVAPARPVCWYSWVILGIWPLLTVLGVLVQWKVTAEGYSHTEVIISRQQRRVQLMRIKQREDRKEKKKKRRPHHPPPHQHKAHPPEPAYRRKPNPVRRFDGDVLSPSYIQSFRERQTGPSLNSLIASSHAVVDLDYDCSSTVPLTTGSGPAMRV
ncbi:transmembrane protein 198 isoform X2 [Centrocercus urophasianus]|uniref:transmembrane protein 198 isoform X2 n=1 Tax=Centrocercus urophasianus TaxID=9002 RepID=UPI001C652E67|nr:transmembrane protein 198 isoform X2 [Centrocercus urophasianus]